MSRIRRRQKQVAGKRAAESDEVRFRVDHASWIEQSRMRKRRCMQTSERTMRRKLAERGDGLLRRDCVCAAMLAPSLLAQVSSYGDKEMGPANDKPPAILNGVGIAQNLNQQLAARR